MAWCRPGDKPLSEPMTDRLPTHICVTRPQWVTIDSDDNATVMACANIVIWLLFSWKGNTHFLWFWIPVHKLLVTLRKKFAKECDLIHHNQNINTDIFTLWKNFKHEYQWFSEWYFVKLTQFGLVMSYGDTNLGQHWFRQWLVACWHQAITWTNADLSKVFCGLHLRAISQEVLINP